MKQKEDQLSAVGAGDTPPIAVDEQRSMPWQLPQANKLLSPTAAAVLVSQATGFIYGYSTTIISGLSSTLVLHTFGRYLNVAAAADQTVATLTGTLTACIFVGGCIGSFLGPICANKYGRRQALFVCGLLAVVTQVLLASINQFVAVVILRAATGIAVGFSCTCGPLYLSEIAPPSLRGRLGVLFEIGITVGALLAYLVNYVLSTGLNGDIDAPINDWRWQLQLGLGAIFGFLLCLLPYYLPETNVSTLAADLKHMATTDNEQALHTLPTPTTASHNNKYVDESELAPRQCLTPIYATNVDSIQLSACDNAIVLVDALVEPPESDALTRSTEITTINVQPSRPSSPVSTKLGTVGSLSATTPAHNNNSPPFDSPMTSGPWQHLFTTRDGSKYLFYAILLCFIDMFTGINAVFFYSPVIFTNAGLSNVLLYTFVAVGIWEFVSCIFPYLLVDRVGRRPLMVYSLAAMTVSQLLLALTFQVFPSGVAPALSIVFLLLFLGAWQLGTGALFFLLATELFPDYCREEACALTNIVSWSLNITISYLFPVLTAAIGQAGMFYIQFGVCAVCLVLSVLYLPETQSQSFASTQYVHK